MFVTIFRLHLSPFEELYIKLKKNLKNTKYQNLKGKRNGFFLY